MQETRKRDHIELAGKSQTSGALHDARFYYEPLLESHPNCDVDLSLKFMGKMMRAPFWISSMTGGVGEARHINQNLARLCREYSLGMGLGSCRTLLESDQYFEDFNLRPILGNELPFFANLGIAQVEKLIQANNHNKIIDLLLRLDADGLIIHVNPLQEWFQPEGDKFQFAPIETISKLATFFSTTKKKLIVKEVGQGLGPKSLKALLDLKIDGIELGGFGGTNFSKLESLRDKNSHIKDLEALTKVGHTPFEMVNFLNSLLIENSAYKNTEIIISGGIRNFLDGYYLRENLNYSSIIGQANSFLIHSENYDDLKAYTSSQIEGLKMAMKFLKVKTQEVR